MSSITSLSFKNKSVSDHQFTKSSYDLSGFSPQLSSFGLDQLLVYLGSETISLTKNEEGLDLVFSDFDQAEKLLFFIVSEFEKSNECQKALRAFLDLAPLPNLEGVYLSTKNKILVESEWTYEDWQKTRLQQKTSVDLNLEFEEVKGRLNLLDTIFLKTSEDLYSLGELLLHPYGAIYLPRFLTEAPSSSFLSWKDQGLKDDSDCTAFESSLSACFLENLSREVSEKSVSLYLAEKPYEDYGYSFRYTGQFRVSEKIDSLVIREVLFDSGELTLTESKLNLDLSYIIDLKKSRMMGSLFHVSSSQTLYITKEDQVRKSLRELFSADKIKFVIKSLGFEVQPDPLKNTVSYEKSFFEAPVEKIKTLKSFFNVELKDSTEILESDSKPLRLKFSNTNKNRLVVTYPEKDAVYSVVLEEGLKILFGIKDGVAGFLVKEAAQIAIKGPKRLNEIKLFKSSGFFIFLLRNYESFYKTESFKEKLWEESYKVIVKILGLDFQKPDLDDLVSPFFKSYIEEVCAKLNSSESYQLLFVDNENVKTLNFKKNLYDFIYPLMNFFVDYYKETLHYKDQIADFNVKLNHDSKEGVSLDLSFPFPVEIAFFMKDNDCSLENEKIEVLNPDLFTASFDVNEISIPDSINKGQQDWFDLDPKYFFDGQEISEEQAKSFRSNSLVNYGGKLYFIPESEVPVVKWLNYFWDKIGSSKDKSKDKSLEKEIRYNRSHVLDILALRQAGLPVKGGKKWEAIAKEYDSIEEKAGIDHQNFNGKLKAFQETGVSWLYQLYKLGLGGILADDMGLGKTVQVLAFLNHLKNLNEAKKFLVVVPTSLVYNWVSESAKFTPQFSVDVFKRDKVEDFAQNLPDILVVTYGMMSEHQSFFLEQDWDIVVFDEAQQLKNIKSIRSEVSRKLSAKVKLCLSGTPMENHYGEYYSLVDLSVPGALGEHSGFMKTYGPRKVSAGSIKKSEIDYLKLKTKPLVLRRTKAQVLKELPPKTESVVTLDFDEQQREIYRNVAMLWNTKIQSLVTAQGESKSQIQMFAALMKLRQICSCPNVVEGAGYDKLSPKLNLVVDQVQELLEAGQSVLVFTNFIITLDSIKKELSKRGLSSLSITGKDAQKAREKTIKDFNEGGAKALLMTLKTGGVGLNLTKASYIIHVEPWWNPAAENQGTDRAHRIGQKNSVMVYRYIMKNSIEEKIQELKKSKQEAFVSLLGDDGAEISENAFSGLKGLSKKDFEYLLS